MGSVPSADPACAGDRGGGLFVLSFRGRSLELTVHAPPDGSHPVSAGEVCAALADLPLDSFPMERVFATVKAQAGVAVTLGEIDLPDGDWAVKVSPNKLRAYFVPASHGEETDLTATDDTAAADVPSVSEADLRARLAALGVKSGLLGDVLACFSLTGSPESVTKVAQGLPAGTGKAATLEFVFDPKPHNAPVEQEDGSVDYRAAIVSRFVEAGAPLVVLHPAVHGEPGEDVLGAAVPARPVAERPLAAISGRDTKIVGDTLVASIGGRPVLHGEKVEVLAVYEVKGDVDFSVGNIEFNGDILVGGDVHPGFVVRAGGSVMVKGIIDRATIAAGRDITARGVSGDDNSYLEAGNAVVAHYIHNATVTAGTLVKAHREIVNCTIHALRVETTSTARIVGGSIEAITEVDAGTIGSPRGVPTRVTVLRGAEGQPAVIRARRSIHARVVVKVHHAVLSVDEDCKGTSFWELDGEISQLGPGASAPKVA